MSTTTTSSRPRTATTRSPDGTTSPVLSCTTTDANMLKVVQTLNPASYLYFVANTDGTCDRIITTNTSSNL